MPTRTHDRAGAAPEPPTDASTRPRAGGPDPFDVKTAAGPTARGPASTVGSRNLVGIFAGGAVAVLLLVIAILVAVAPSGPPPVVTIISVPSGASVRLDGRSIAGTTPLDLEGVTEEQEHRLEVSLTGYETWTRTITGAGEAQRQIAVLTPRRATLRVQSEPTGAHVWVDGVLFGTTPLRIPGLAVNRLLHIRAAKTGEGEAESTVVISATELEPRLVLELEPVAEDPD
jgi:hypothetical protein